MRLAVDTTAGSLADVEHLVHQLDEVLDAQAGGAAGDTADPYVVSTHVVREPLPHYVLVIDWPDGPPASEVADRITAALPGTTATTSSPALDEARERRAGRLARYPGRLRVERPTTPAEVVSHSVIDEVEGLAGVPVDADSPVDLTGFARPVWREGRCVLLVQRSVTGLVPFEVRAQVPCCSHH